MADDDDTNDASSDWGAVTFTFSSNLVILAAFLVVFWVLRGRYRSVYSTRQFHVPDKYPGDLPSGFLNWIPFVYNISDESFLRMCGLDALVWIRFERLGLRMCLTLGVLGMAIIVPCNLHAGGEEEGLARFTMANIKEGSHYLWAPLILAYVFTAISVQMLRKEYSYFIELRHGELRRPEPHHYSAMVEELPATLRSDAELKAYFESLFPGNVQSAVVASDLSALEQLIEKREEVLAKLEVAKVVSERSGKAVTHSPSMCGGKVDSVTEYSRQLKELNALVESLQTSDANLREEVERKAMDRLLNAHEVGAELLMSALSVQGIKDAANSLHNAVTSVEGAKSAVLGVGESLVAAPTMVLGTAFEGTKWLGDLLVGSGISSTGFVSFSSLTAVASARQMLLTQQPQSIIVTSAPAPNDVFWPAVMLTREQIAARGLIINAGIAALVLFWATLVAAVVSVSSIEQLSKLLPFLKGLTKSNPVLMASISGYLPTISLLALQGLLPTFLLEVFNRAGIKSKSQIQRQIFLYFFMFQLNDLIIMAIASSLYDSLAEIADNPSSVLSLLGTSLPKSSVLLTSYVLIKALSGMGAELARAWPVLRLYVRRLTGGTRTPRERRAVHEPDVLDFGAELPKQALVLVVALCYSLIAPLTLVPCGLFFALGHIVYKHNFLYVYVQQYESYGMYWALLFRRAVWAVIVLHVTLIGFFSLKAGYYQLPLMVPLPFLTLLFADHTEAAMGQSSAHLPLDVAVKLDAKNGPVTFGEHTAYLQPALLEPADKQPDLEVRPSDMSDVVAADVAEAVESGEQGGSYQALP